MKHPISLKDEKQDKKPFLEVMSKIDNATQLDMIPYKQEKHVKPLWHISVYVNC